MGEHCRVYRRRWLMLTLFALCSCVNAAHWIQYSIIATVCMYYYDVSALYIDWTSIIYMAVYIPLVFPASWLLEKKGLRWSIIFGTLLMCGGAWLKVLTARPDGFDLTFAAQTIVGSAQMFTLGVPARLAAIWFPQEQVSTACAIGVFGNQRYPAVYELELETIQLTHLQLGIAIGFLLPPSIVRQGDDKEVIGKQLYSLYLYMAIAPSVVLALIVLLFEARPPLPPSMAQLVALKKEGEDRPSFLSSIGSLLTDRDFSPLLVSFGLNIGVFYVYSTLLNQELTQSMPGGGYDHAGFVGMMLVFGGVVGSLVWGIVLDKTKKYKDTTLGVYLMAVLGMLGFTFAISSQHWALVYATSAFLGFFMNGYITVGYEFGAELTFPHAETTTSGLLNAAGETCGVASVLVAGRLLEMWGPVATNLALSGVLALGLLIGMPISRHRLPRQAASSAPEPDHAAALNY